MAVEECEEKSLARQSAQYTFTTVVVIVIII